MEHNSIQKLGASRIGVWLIRHVVSPLDRALYRWTGGRYLTLGRPLAPTLLLTTRGRKSGRLRTTPVFYLRDGQRIIVCNVNPGFERTNPWTLNIRANPIVEAQLGSVTQQYRAREATIGEVTMYWPQLVKLWPAYAEHYARSGERSIFVLEAM